MTPPAAPSNLSSGSSDTTRTIISGRAEPDSTITIRDAAGNEVGTGTTLADGTWSVTLYQPLINSEALDVVATDAAGNASLSSTVAAPDLTPPAAPTNLSSDSSDTTRTIISGRAEPDSTITILGPDGTEVGTGTVEPDGNWSVNLDSSFTNGEVLTAIASDAKGNKSTPATVEAPDTTAPSVPEGLVVSSSGLEVSGTGEAGSTIKIFVPDGTEVGTGTVDPDGNWSVNLDSSFTNGEILTAIASDAKGNKSTPATVEAPDTAAPSVPEGLVVSSSGLEVSGTGEAGSTIKIFVPDGTEVGTGTVDPDGNWSVNLDSSFTNGEILTAIASDAKGNKSTPATVEAHDTTVPDAPVISTSVAIDSDGMPFEISSGGLTRFKTLKLTGTAEPAAIITISYLGRMETFEANEDGAWSFTPGDLADGEHHFEISATDAAGNTGQPTPFTLTIDTVAPDAPLIESGWDNVGATQGSLHDGASTDDTTPTLNGTAEAGARISIFHGETFIGNADVDTNGQWSFTTPELPNGNHSFTVTATDAAGNPSLASTLFELTVGTEAPAVPSDIQISWRAMPHVSGKADFAGSVTILHGDDLLGQVETDPDGYWETDEVATWLQAAGLPEGNYGLTAIAIDSEGTSESPSTVNIFPRAMLTISGKAEAGSIVTIFHGPTRLAEVQADENGNWQKDSYGKWLNDYVLPDGNNRLTAIATDAAGNESGSYEFDLLIDQQEPPKPLITNAVEDLSDTPVAMGLGGYTRDSTPTLTGTAEGGAIIKIYEVVSFDDSTYLGYVVADSVTGEWSFTPKVLGDGVHVFFVEAIDAYGNKSEPSDGFELKVDTIAPELLSAETSSDGATLVLTYDEALDASNAPLADSFVVHVDDNQVDVTDVTVVDASVVLSLASPVLHGAVVSVTYTDPSVDDDGEALQDAVGNDAASLAATPVTNTVPDTTGPVLVSAVTSSNGYWLVLTYDEALANSNSVASFVVNVNDTPVWVFEMTVQDDRVELALASPVLHGDTVTVDYLRPPAGHGRSPIMDVHGNEASNLTGAQVTNQAMLLPYDIKVSSNDEAKPGYTNDSTPAISGKAAAGSIITIYDGGQVLGVVEADGEGNWQTDADGEWLRGSTLHDAVYRLTATATDATGNTSGYSGIFELTVDTIAPSVPKIDSAFFFQRPPLVGGAEYTLLTGTSDAGAVVKVYSSLGEKPFLGSIVADVSGKWTIRFEPPAASKDGVVVTATDAAGNSSVYSDSVVPTPTFGPGPQGFSFSDDNGLSIAMDGSADDMTPLFSGTTEAGRPMTAFGGATAEESRTWFFMPEESLDESSRQMTADTTGTEGDASGGRENTVEEVAPEAATGFSLASMEMTEPLLFPASAEPVSPGNGVESGAESTDAGLMPAQANAAGHMDDPQAGSVLAFAARPADGNHIDLSQLLSGAPAEAGALPQGEDQAMIAGFDSAARGEGDAAGMAFSPEFLGFTVQDATELEKLTASQPLLVV
ncbi:Ig-like domain-containing protein [Comamonas endophytica]|uniref:Ig-like domain-containing protein n=1 Tax=Comamonas endophytica TaxID=2949090 RepID=UPI002102982D|nr:Ig-like domain-containing protein [Acidovorax sp. D4N7]